MGGTLPYGITVGSSNPSLPFHHSAYPSLRRVAHIIDNGCWNITQIAPLLPTSILNEILATPLSRSIDLQDSVRWAHTPGGNFFIKTISTACVTVATQATTTAPIGRIYGKLNFLTNRNLELNPWNS